jgi:predicted GNAT family N-acyltransferase
LEVRLARDEREVAAALDLPERVFCGEQGVSLAAERDGRDPEALHVVAVRDGRLIGTCRLVLDGEVAKLGRMAVEAGERGGGVGAAILAASERCARESGARRITLHAQTAVKALYSRHGYIPHGEPFVEEGIDHVAMDKLLA